MEGCLTEHYARTYCARHYARWKAYGDPLGGGPDRHEGKLCSIENCGRPYEAKDLCKLHYYRAMRGQPLNDPVYSRGSRAPVNVRLCTVQDCERKHYANGYCGKHYQRWKQYGDAEAPLRRAVDGEGWRGTNDDGYIVLKCRGKTVLEHRAIMEQVLGRPLYPFENVHHKNGVRTDNQPENLELWVKAQPCGQRPEDLVAFVVQHYPDLVRDALG